MKRNVIYLMTVLVSFGAGFGLCYKMDRPHMTQAPIAAGPNVPIRLTMVTGQPEAYVPVIPNAEDKLDWEPYLIHPTLPPKVIERYHYNPQQPAPQPDQTLPQATIRFEPTPTGK